MDITALTLFGRARYQVLACLFALRKGEGLHLREIARRSGLSPTAVQYELRLLTAAGVVELDNASGRMLYRVNFDHAAANELGALIRKTDATADGAEPRTGDATHWARKRAQQAQDYAEPRLVRRSPFAARGKRKRSFEVDFSAVG